MYIKYELYRAKNGELFNAEMIEWPLNTDEDIIEIKERMTQVLTQHIQSLDEVKKYGTAYIGKMKIAGIEINDNDYICDLDREHFENYIHDINVLGHIDIKWNKKDDSNVETNK